MKRKTIAPDFIRSGFQGALFPKTQNNMENKNKQTHTIYATIKIEVESELNYEDAVDEFTENCIYDFLGTEDCKVKSTEWTETY